MTSKDERITALEQAILNINSWIQASEGVSVLYYAGDWKENPSDAESAQIVKELIDGESDGK